MDLLIAKGQNPDNSGYMLFLFDVVKLTLYTLYFTYLNIINVLQIWKNNETGLSDYFLIAWNLTVNLLNIVNFVYFYQLSESFGVVNELIYKNEFIDSSYFSNVYWRAQLLDSFLVVMNFIMIVQFT